MTPARSYTVRRRAFRLNTSLRDSGYIYCLRCNRDAIDLGARFPDVGILLELCREHEIARHSATITWREFRRGWEVETVDPAYLRALTEGALKFVATRPRADGQGTIPVLRRRVRHEWLADSGPRSFGRPPAAVTVREPESLAAWLGPEKAATELLAA